MKIAVIGANGRLGRYVTKKALDNGHSVTAYVVTSEGVDKRAKIASNGDLFALTTAEVQNYDAVVSCFGSGFNVDPVINYDVCKHFINIFKNINTRIIHIIGSGSLYVDEKHESRIYELPNHPEILRGISAQAALGLEAFLDSKDVKWTVVMPSITFTDDYLGNNKYEVGQNLVPLKNNKGESLVTYNDLAQAMLDCIENNSYISQAITILSK